jgi:hypothetical protein
MAVSNSHQEHSGYCARHRVIFSWQGAPFLRDALCPIPGCGEQLQRSSHKRGECRAAKPLERSKPTLKMVEVQS